MFDTIAPRYDLVNRVMTFRMDVRLAQAHRARPPARRRAPRCSTWRAAPATSAASSSRAGLRPIGFDLSFGMLAAARTDAPLAQADALRLPVPDGSRRRRHLRVRPAQPRRARRRSSPSWPGCVRPGGRIALLEVAEPPNRGAALRATASTSARSCPLHRRAALRPRRLPLPARSRWPTCPSPSEMLAHARPTPASPTSSARLLSGGHLPADHGHPARAGAVTPGRLRRPRPARSTRRRPAAGRRRRRGAVRAARRRARRRGASPRTSHVPPGDPAAPRPPSPPRSARIEVDDAVDLPGTRPGGPRRARRSTRPRRPSWSVPARRRGPGRRRHPLGHHRSRRRRRADDRDAPSPRPADAAGSPTTPGSARPTRAQPRSASRSDRDPADVVRRGRPQATRRARGGDAPQGRAGPRGRRSRPTRPCAAAPCSRGSAAPTRRATSSPSTASSAPAPSCSWPGVGDVVRGPPHGRHRTPQRRPRHRRPPRRRAARVDQGPRGAPAHHRHGARHAAALVLVPRRGGRAVDRRHGQRAAPGHRGRGPAVAPAGVGARAGGRAAPDPGGRRRPREAPLEHDRRARGARPRVATPGRSAGSTPPATASGRSASAAPSSTARRARLFAGVGVVADSDPAAELAETRAKLQAVLGALIRP